MSIISLSTLHHIMNALYIAYTSVLFMLLFMVWSRSSWTNLLIKTLFFASFVGSLILSLKNYSVI